MVGTPWRMNSFPVPPRVIGPGLLNPPSALSILGKPNMGVNIHNVAPGFMRNATHPMQHIQAGILASPTFGRGSPLAARQKSNDRLTRPQQINRSPRQYQQQHNNFSRNNNKDVMKKKLSKKEIQEKAMSMEVSKDFYDKVKTVSVRSKSSNIALEFAQRKYCDQVKRKFPMIMLGSGGHSCSICKVAHTSRKDLESHYDAPSHRQLEEIYDIFKEQSFLILDGKIKLKEDSENNNMENIIHSAEKEMNLNAKELDLDAYILGIYESVMRQYWPVPKSSFYCRICNYSEFANEHELNKHLISRIHKDFEASYDEAFCLYCQRHNGNKLKMADHEKTDKHKEVKELMDKAKEQAIVQWHNINNKSLPPIENRNFKTSSSPTNSGVKTTTGSKRSNNSFNDDMSSPTKKRNENFSALQSPNENNISSTSSSLHDSSLSPDESTWFVPVYGFMCIACRKFLSNSTEQKNHSSLASHRQSIEKFKLKIIDAMK